MIGGIILFFVLIPAFWIAMFAIFGAIARRRWARHGGAQFAGGPFGGHGWGHGPGWARGSWAAARHAETTLAERFAQGDIDEKEYRARLEVLRANAGGSAPAAE